MGTMVKVSCAFLLMVTPWQVHSWIASPTADISLVNRRSALSTLIVAPVVTAVASPALAATTTDATGGLVSADRVGDLLRAVPTFAIVDAKGVPFMVVGEDAKVTSYFFTTFGEAKHLLDLAKTSADKGIKQAKKEGEKDVGDNPWNLARISTVPLDFAVTMASKSTSAGVFQVAPDDADVEDALALIKKDDLAEGKVPLFYFEKFTVDHDGQQEAPLYFHKSELLSAWKREKKGEEPPKVLVTELFYVLKEMLKPGGTDQELKTIMFMAPADSDKKAKECKKASKESPFELGQRIVVL